MCIARQESPGGVWWSAHQRRGGTGENETRRFASRTGCKLAMVSEIGLNVVSSALTIDAHGLGIQVLSLHQSSRKIPVLTVLARVG